MNISPHDLVQGAVEIASPPHVYLRATQVLDDPRAGAEEIGRVVETDPGLTARLLKIVNSAFYGFQSRIATISRAVTVVGTRELHDLILATSVVDTFAGLPNELVDMESFWRHSLRCGILARILASHHRDRDRIEPLFSAGLLHDIGSLIMYNKLPELARAALVRAASGEVEVHQAERDLLGFDHAAIGRELMALWKLPPLLQETTGCHHDPDQAQDFPVEAALVYLANRIAGALQRGVTDWESLFPPGHSIWKRTGLRFEVLEPTLATLDRQFDEILSVVLRRYRH